jgi:hypothetical protein
MEEIKEKKHALRKDMEKKIAVLSEDDFAKKIRPLNNDYSNLQIF